MGKIGRRAKKRWFLVRYDTLVGEGFTPEEANLIANVRMSGKNVRRLRHRRLAMLERSAKELSAIVNRPVSMDEIKTYHRERVRVSQEEMINWEGFIKELYGDGKIQH